MTTSATFRSDVVTPPLATTRVAAAPDAGEWLLAHTAPGGGILAACLGLLVATVSIGTNAADRFVVPVCLVMLVAQLFLLVHVFRVRHEVDPPLVIIFGATLLATGMSGALPLYFASLGQSAIFHRSTLSILLLGAASLPLLCSSLFHFLGGTPSAEDAARYPLVLVPALLLLITYAGLLGALLVRGLPDLSWSVIVGNFTPPTATTRLQAGFANHVRGTGLLMVLTCAFSLPVGVGTGVFLNEYAPDRVASVVRFCTTALRGISVLLLGLTAVSLIQVTQGTPLGGFLVGTFEDSSGQPMLQGGSFVLAAGIISLLVIPVIARATEEGCRSVPHGLREGSAALGAAEEVTLWRLVLPWALPNIVTSLLLGAAEAAGSLATLLFIGSTGVQGVGLLKPVTSLSYALFDAQYSTSKPFRDAMEPHQMGGAVLLLAIALALTTAGLFLKHRYGSRYRGA
jgi:phosphate transport system permease protein